MREGDRLHFRLIMLYEFQKNVGTARNLIQKVYLDRATAIRAVKKGLGRFPVGDVNLNDKPHTD